MKAAEYAGFCSFDVFVDGREGRADARKLRSGCGLARFDVCRRAGGSAIQTEGGARLLAAANELQGALEHFVATAL